MGWLSKIIRRKRSRIINKALKQARNYSTDVKSRIEILEKHFNIFQKQGQMSVYVELYSKLVALKAMRDRQDREIIEKVKIVMV